MSAFSTTYELGSSTALIPCSNSPFIKNSIGGRGNYRKNLEVIEGLTFGPASGQSVTSFQNQPTGATTALPSGADRMKEKLVGLFKAGK